MGLRRHPIKDTCHACPVLLVMRPARHARCHIMQFIDGHLQWILCEGHPLYLMWHGEAESEIKKKKKTALTKGQAVGDPGGGEVLCTYRWIEINIHWYDFVFIVCQVCLQELLIFILLIIIPHILLYSTHASCSALLNVTLLIQFICCLFSKHNVFACWSDIYMVIKKYLLYMGPQ